MEENALFKLTQGLYVLGGRDHADEKRFVGSTIDAVMQIAIKPFIVAVSCVNTSYTRECIDKTGEFSISALGKNVDPFVVANFGFQTSRVVNKWDNVEYYEDDGLPYLQHNIATLRGKVLSKSVFTSNTLFIAEIVDCKNGEDFEPLTYTDYRSYFKNDVMEAMKEYRAKQK